MSDADDLAATIRLFDQWRTLEVTLQARGLHRLPDGSLYMQAEYLLEVRVPDHDTAKLLLAALDGRPTETSPVTTGEQLTLSWSDPGELVADNPGADYS